LDIVIAAMGTPGGNHQFASRLDAVIQCRIERFRRERRLQSQVLEFVFAGDPFDLCNDRRTNAAPSGTWQNVAGSQF